MDVAELLLDSDPAIRWQVLRDLAGAPAEIVAAERARVATEGWGARLLALQGDDGQWAGGACFPGGTSRIAPITWASRGRPLSRFCSCCWNSEFIPRTGAAVTAVAQHCRWEHDGQPFFDGEVESCINGRVVSLGAYFGQPGEPVVERLLGEQLEDGGWNCEAENGSVRSSFDTTINVLEGLLAYERGIGSSPGANDARRRGEEYLLERKLFRRISSGEVVEPAWLQFSFPPRWHYDVLRALDYFRAAGGPPDPRMAEAMELVHAKHQSDGRWLLENTHSGAVHFELEEGDGSPSRWNTLRALRVLKWWEGTSG